MIHFLSPVFRSKTRSTKASKWQKAGIRSTTTEIFHVHDMYVTRENALKENFATLSEVRVGAR